MKHSELRAEAERILCEVREVWDFDGRDFSKPSLEEMIRERLESAPESGRARLANEFLGAGPLETLLSRSRLQEIIINGPEEIWFEEDGRFTRLEDAFLTPVTFQGFVERFCTEAGVKVDLSQPFADGRWRDFRLHLGRAPLTHCSFHLSLRRLPHDPWTLERLGEVGWANEARMKVLRTLLSQRRNVLFIGPTGCGKTTVLGACLRELPEQERAVILEDTDELPRPNSASTKLLTRPPGALGEISLTDLVRQSLRMRPMRLVLGEVRGPEAKDLLLALATGHSGSLGTLHASDPRQALLRLEMLVQLGAPQWNAQTVRQLIQLSIEALVVCGNENGHRRLEGIYRVAALESFGFLLEPMT